MFELKKVQITDMRIIEVFGGRFAEDLKILFELEKV